MTLNDSANRPETREKKYKVFVSYRHVDGHAVARIVEFLNVVFGKSAVFHDLRSIPAGIDFRQALQEAVSRSELVLAVIGPTWIESFSERALRTRGADPDWVQVELEQAFHEGVRVVPAILHPARIPAREELPDSPIQELAFRTGRVIYPDLAFENSVHQLVDEIQVILDPSCTAARSSAFVSRESPPVLPRKRGRRLRVFGVIIVTAVLCAGMIVGIGVVMQPPANTSAKGIQKPPAARLAQIERQIRSLRAGKPLPMRERLSNSRSQASLGTPDYSSFEILADERTWDLRGYRPYSPESRPFSSFAIATRQIRLLKAGPAKEVVFEARTSGTDVFLNSPSHGAQATEVVSDTPAYVGGVEMKVRQIAIDVSGIAEGAEINLTLQMTYWDGFRTAEDNWVGVIGYPHADLVSLFVLLPEDRPYKRISLSNRPTARDPAAPFDGECVLFEAEDRTAVFWEIPFPSANHVFTLNWEW